MPSTGFQICGTAVNTDTGGSAWSSPSQATADDGSITQTGLLGIFATIEDFTIQLIKGGTAQGDNNADTGTAWPTSLAKRTYGGAADLWSLSLSESDVEASNFGARVAAQGNSGESDALDCTNFGFSIPAGATIDGIEVRVDRQRTTEFNNIAQVDVVEINVHYTEAAGGIRSQRQLIGHGQGTRA